MLPIFPTFKELELADLPSIEKFTKQFPPYNDFGFLSLWTYNTRGGNAISTLYNNLVIKIQDFITGDFFYSFLGTNRVRETIEILLARSKQDNLNPILRLVPEVNIKSSPNLSKYFSVNEDPDSFDYILSVKELATLEGSKFHNKKNLVYRFKSQYTNHYLKLLDLTLDKTRQDVRDLFFLWEKQRGKDRSETEIELIAIEKMFDLVDVLQIIGIGIYFNEKLIGFASIHNTSKEFAILVFEKCDTLYKGIFEYLNHEVAKYLLDDGVRYINYEQDLGIPGLKKAKMLWRPIFFLKKFTVA